MNKRISIHRYITLFFVLTLCVIQINAQKRITTDFKDYYFEEFNAENIKNLNIQSQHADISIMNWDKDSVSIETVLEILSDKPNLSKEMLEEIDIRVSEYTNTLQVKTILSSDFHSTIPYKINYTIFCPERLSLEIANKHGKNCYWQAIRGVTASLSNCDLSINNIAASNSIGNNHLKFSFCKGIISNIGSVVGTINTPILGITNSDSLKITSSYSILQINNNISYQGSTSIDNIDIKNTETVMLSGKNSMINIGKFGHKALFELTNGSLNILNSSSIFKELTVNNNNTKTSIKLNDKTSYTINGEINNGKLIHTKKDKIKIIEDNNTQSFIGELGLSNNKSQSKVIIFNRKQNVKIH